MRFWLGCPRNHQSRACRWQALFLFDQASSGLARQALWRDWSDDSRFPVATSENPGIGEGEGTRGPGRATVFRNCEHFDRLLTSSYFGAPSGHTDDHLVHSLVKRRATRGRKCVRSSRMWPHSTLSRLSGTRKRPFIKFAVRVTADQETGRLARVDSPFAALSSVSSRDFLHSSQSPYIGVPSDRHSLHRSGKRHYRYGSEAKVARSGLTHGDHKRDIQGVET